VLIIRICFLILILIIWRSFLILFSLSSSVSFISASIGCLAHLVNAKLLGEKLQKYFSILCLNIKRFLLKIFQSIVFNLEPLGHRLNKTKTTHIGH